MMKNRKIKHVVVLGVAAGLLSYILPSFAMSEADEMTSASKLSGFISSSIEAPMREAANQHQDERAVILADRIIALWEQENYQTAAAKTVQSRAIDAVIEQKAHFLLALHRYEEAAQLFLRRDSTETDRIKRTVPELMPPQTDELSLGQLGSITRYTLKSLPYSHPYLLAASQAYIDGKMYEKAEALLRQYCDNYFAVWSLPAHVQLSQIYLAEGNPSKAENELKTLLAEHPFADTGESLRSVRIELKKLYVQEKKVPEADKIEALLQDKHCPKCGSTKHVLPIAYGRMVGTPKHAVAGGCCIDQYSPLWCCTSDGTKF